jgi:hypothetical protein
MSSGDQAASLNSLRFAATIPAIVYGAPGYAELENKVWESRVTGILHKSSAELAVAAGLDPYIRQSALWWEVISVRQALEMPGGLGEFFRHSKDSLFRQYGRAPYSRYIYYHLARGWPTFTTPKIVADLEEVGEHLRKTAKFPWIHGRVDMAAVGHHDIHLIETSESAQFGPIAYLGAAAILAIQIESGYTAILDRHPRQLGPLGILLSYLKRRRGDDPDTDLVDLPIPEEFRQVFRDWAEGRINFVGPG